MKAELGNTIKCRNAVETTNVPLQKPAVIVQVEWDRTYDFAIRIPKGSVEGCLLYDNADPYVYVRLVD